MKGERSKSHRCLPWSSGLLHKRTVYLFHFSERGDIARFDPRPVAVAAPRKPGHEWLNGPLVWATDDWHEPMSLFPRDCPRVLVWPTANSTAADRALWLDQLAGRMTAYLERA